METGLLAPVGDADKLSANVVRLLNEKILKQTLADQAFAFVKRFSKEQTTSKTFKIYQEVLNK